MKPQYIPKNFPVDNPNCQCRKCMAACGARMCKTDPCPTEDICRPEFNCETFIPENSYCDYR